MKKVTLRLDQIDKLDPDQRAALKQQTKTTDLADRQIPPDSGAPPKSAKKVSVNEAREQAVKRLMGPTAAKLFKASDELARIQRMLGPSIGELAKGLYPSLGEMARRQQEQWRENLYPSAATIAQRESERWLEVALGRDWTSEDPMQAFAAATGSTVVDYADVLSTSSQRALLGIDPVSAGILGGVENLATISGLPDAHAEYLHDQMARLQAFETSAYDDYMRDQLERLEALTGGSQAKYVNDYLAQLQVQVPTLEDLVSQFDTSSSLARLLGQTTDWGTSSLSSWTQTQQLLHSLSWADVLETAERIGTATSPVREGDAALATATTKPAISLEMRIAIVMWLIVFLFGDGVLKPFLSDRFAALPAAPTQADTAVRETQDWATVSTPTVIHVAPNAKSGVLFELPIGAWIRVLEKKRSWLLVEVETGESSLLRGWISLRATKPLNEVLFQDAFEQVLTAKKSQQLANTAPSINRAAANRAGRDR